MSYEYIIIDGYNFLYRAYYSLSNLRSKNNTPIGGIYGFINMILGIYNNYSSAKFLIALDASGPNFRHELYNDYKATRSETPEELIIQFPILTELLEEANISFLRYEGYESDDIIAQFVYRVQNENSSHRVLICSSDKDLFQLISPQCNIYDSLKSIVYDDKKTFEKFGVYPSQIADYLALMGDSSDNIPGVAGVGAKTAAKLLNDLENLDNIYTHLDSIISESKKDKTISASVMNKLVKDRDNAYLSKSLTNLSIRHEDLYQAVSLDMPKEISLANSNIIAFLNKYDMHSLSKKIRSMFSINAEEGQNNQHEFTSSIEVVNITDTEMQNEIIQQAQENLKIAVHFVILKNHIDWFGFGIGHIFYYGNSSGNSHEEIVTFLRNTILSSNAFQLIGYDIKTLYKILFAKYTPQDIRRNFAIDDLMLMNYIFKGVTNNFSSIAKFYDSNTLAIDSNSSITEIGMWQDTMNLQKVSWSREYCKILFMAHQDLLQEIARIGKLDLYYSLDKIFLQVVSQIEYRGMYVDIELLQELQNEIDIQIKEKADSLYKIFGNSNINLASSAQVATKIMEIVPNEQLSQFKKSKSGLISTDIDVLETLDFMGYEFANTLISWRHLTKLMSTYIIGLQAHIQKNNGYNIISTSLNTTYTNTGRLSSTRPNLQNIPARSEIGRRIRNIFIAPKGYEILAIDYSQIELRILAEIANISAMKEAFENGVDIHTMTASQIFNLSIDQVTTHHRRQAKAINFGIIYKITSYGLAKQIGSNIAEAKHFIDAYFDKYPEIKTYFDSVIQFGRSHGYVQTITGRRCYIENLSTGNNSLKQIAERAAVNAPIQGSAADIMRHVMNVLYMNPELNNENCYMTLQIHDEILFVIKSEYKDFLIPKIAHIMKSAPKNLLNETLLLENKILPFSAPLEISIQCGACWT